MAPTTNVKLDPIYAVYCKQAKLFPKASKGEITIHQLRVLSDENSKKQELPDVIEEDKVILYKGTELRMTLFRPPGTENDILPVVIYFHGGGSVCGSKYTHGKPVRDICLKNNVAVVFSDYLLAPEAQFPKAHQDCYLTISWVAENASTIMVDHEKIAVCGDSAGAGFCACAMVKAKENGLGNAIKTQILLYPITARTRENFESSHLFGGEDYNLTAEDAIFYTKTYYGEDPTTDKFGFPLLATVDELKDLPRTLIVTAEADVLRDEAEAYYRKLIEAGVSASSIRILGAVHGFINIPFETSAYKQTMQLISYQLKGAFH
ncbi:Alpha/Beta hydrolase protein [Phascolomyces articulosus]|uniref:Alpha/Beta hydrolase protein n=1 Tax=Phascolomyces articulosus TaxID=60185 RepID=A0AAD5PD51_9FUNG|nr:Alpha/Beta hydrolase protein [Phascolomyces articulosus]